MAKYRTIRVYPTEGDWVVKKDSAEKASVKKSTKEAALKAARDIAINQGLTIIIHGKDGRIQRTVTPEEASSNDNCFITTACTKYYGLNDNCYQLRTLRKFRDEYLLKTSQGRMLVQQYYLIAPNLVRLLELDKNKEKNFEEVFQKINSACAAIENKKLSQAKAIYKEAIIHLLNYFKIA